MTHKRVIFAVVFVALYAWAVYEESKARKDGAVKTKRALY